MTLRLRELPDSNSLIRPVRHEAGESRGETMPGMRSDYPHQARDVGPQRSTGRDGAAPAATFRLGKATVVELPGAALDVGHQTPMMIDAGWLSAQLWRAVLGK